MTRAMMLSQGAAGFTLVELLVAMTLLGFLTVLLFGGLRFGTRAWEDRRRITPTRMPARSAESLLATDDRASLPPPAVFRDASSGRGFRREARQMTWLPAAVTAAAACSGCA